MTVIKGILIPAEESDAATVVELEQGDLKAMQDCVGGYVQMVDGTNPDLTFVINEEGKVHNLPLNRRGTLMLWVHNNAFQGYDYFNGDVLVIGPADEETGESTSAPAELIELFFNTERYRYLVQTGGSTWDGNGVTYDNWVDAYNYGLALAKRWTLVTAVKVVAAS